MRQVFVNRTLNMKRITHIGLDMDHTLIRYNSRNFETLAYETMLKKLVEVRSYPQSILQLKFDYDSTIRGLVIDKSLGNILKLSRYGAIRVSHHGSKPIDFGQQNKVYKSKYVDLKDPNFDTVDTTFSISFAALFAQLVDLKDGAEIKTLPDYATIAEDLNFVLDQAHRDGSLKSVVTADPGRFIIKDQALVEGLERYRLHNKKIFLLTNSEYQYTRVLLDYAINPFLKRHQSWRELFTFVINSADKPRFFYDRLKFLRIDPDTGTMTNQTGPLTPGVYQGGCASTFTGDLGLDPDEILYVGDHIYGDIVRLKKDCAWRTALVIEELETETENCKAAAPIQTQIADLMEQKLPLEIELDELISDHIEKGQTPPQNEVNSLLERIARIDQQLSPLIKKQQGIFNANWGEVMRVGIEESYFAYQMERFACIYMARLTDLLECSPRTYFRSQRRRLPHDIY